MAAAPRIAAPSPVTGSATELVLNLNGDFR